MFKALISREYNLNNKSDRLDKIFIKNRIESLDLSSRHEFESCHTANVNCCDLDPNGQRYLLSAAGNGNIFIHDLHTPPSSSSSPRIFKVVSKIDATNEDRHYFSVGSIQWYPHDTGIFTSSGREKLLKLWDSNNLKVVTQFTFEECVNCHKMAGFKPIIAVGSDSDKIQLVDITSGSFSHKLTGHSQRVVLDLYWSASNNHHLYSAGKDGHIILWDIRRSKSCLLKFDKNNTRFNDKASPNPNGRAHDGVVNSILLLQDGLHLLSFGTDNNVRLWDSQSGKNLLCNYGMIANDSKVGLRMACCDRYAFVPNSENVTILDVFNGTQIKTLQGHFKQVNCCLFKSDQYELITGARDRNILLWDAFSHDDDDDGDADDDRKKRLKSVRNAPEVKRNIRDLNNDVGFNRFSEDNWSDVDE
ncbi:hypothetical protein HELRODRAFT_88668 [Helobdella robusta]|uniref:Uncharacterized protein n=1 Tax=Helobdella robusta TaxID=6412 RepID=T1G752_HELRO|nr:hypothetical protein HELRODRAFT_88668 [Helobdella robusta]ESN93569.1 hypothetical protein HELRODRAFT_88668 [Helobdella robusta]